MYVLVHVCVIVCVYVRVCVCVYVRVCVGLVLNTVAITAGWIVGYKTRMLMTNKAALKWMYMFVFPFMNHEGIT